MWGLAMPERSLQNLPHRLIASLALVAVPASLLLSGCLATTIDQGLNPVYELTDPPRVEAVDRARHAGLFIVDLHADTVMWDRDLLARADYGHVDLPRLVDGNVALQVFVVVTQTPEKGVAPEDARLIGGVASRRCIAPDSVNFTGLLQIAQLRPLETWFDLEARAMYQAERLRAFIRASEARREIEPDAPVLLAIETAPREWEAFWTFDPPLVSEIEAYIATNL